MQTIDNLLQEDDPVDMVLAELFSQHPNLATFPAGTFTVSKIKPSAGSRNTEAVITASVVAGIKGKTSIFYDRADLGRVFNSFGDTTIVPAVYIAADVGSVLSVNDILDQLNNALGIKLKTTGSFLDVTSFNFTAAAKGGMTVIQLSGKAGTADGTPPVSARVLPGKPIRLEIHNRGSHINKKAINRSITPFIKTDGGLNWGGETIYVTAPKKSLLLALRTTDFSDIFNSMSSGSWLYYAGYGFSVHKWLFNAELSAAIKARCVELDIPVIDFSVAQQTGRAATGQAQMEGLVFRLTSNYPGDTAVSRRYTKAVALGDSFTAISSPVGQTAIVKPSIEARLDWATDFNNYPIHFNTV